MDAPEASQLHHGARDGGEDVTDVQLHDLVARTIARVADDTADRERAFTVDHTAFDRKIRVLEGGVAQTETEREGGLPGKIDIVIAAARRFVVVVQRQLSFGHGESDRQSARRIVVAEQDIRHGVPALVARVPDVQHRIDVIDPVRHRDGTASDSDDCDRRPRGRDLPDQLGLMAGQRQARAVAELAFLDARDDNGDVRITRGLDRLGNGRPPVRPHTRIPDQLQPRIARALEVLDAQVVGTARLERDLRQPHAVRPLAPVVDQQLAVQPQAVAIIALDAEPCETAGGYGQPARPARRVPVERDAAARRIQGPAEIEPPIGPDNDRLAFERVVRPVLAAQTLLECAVRRG